MLALALGVMGPAMGCGESQCAAGCWPGVPSANVRMDPWVRSTYDVTLVLDGASGAFTCEGHPTDQTGIGQLVVECGTPGFLIQATPESVELSGDGPRRQLDRLRERESRLHEAHRLRGTLPAIRRHHDTWQRTNRLHRY